MRICAASLVQREDRHRSEHTIIFIGDGFESRVAVFAVEEDGVNRNEGFVFPVCFENVIVCLEITDGRVHDFAVGEQEDRIWFESHGDSDSGCRVGAIAMLDGADPAVQSVDVGGGGAQELGLGWKLAEHGMGVGIEADHHELLVWG